MEVEATRFVIPAQPVLGSTGSGNLNSSTLDGKW